MASESWWEAFPQLSKDTLREIRINVDSSYREFSREYGQTLEDFSDPLLQFLIWLENLMMLSPWPIVLATLLGLAWAGSKSLKVVFGIAISMFVIGFFGMWEDTMRTLSITAVCTLVSIVLGLPIGILMAKYNVVRNFVTPILDVMQTMPSFVYLIPVVMLLGIGKVPGLMAVVIYAIPPMIRLTDLGIRQVDQAVIEAAESFGCNSWQKLRHVQLPLALPSIFAGVNQTIMMALAMVVIASMIGVQGLGQPVLKAITNQYFTMGLMNGLAIVALAIAFDRVSQSFGKRLQRNQI
tara:strand:+ start:24336 stop:25220 length:885 start_codon:yes stop_codon:yes gene_type:complete